MELFKEVSDLIWKKQRAIEQMPWTFERLIAQQELCSFILALPANVREIVLNNTPP